MPRTAVPIPPALARRANRVLRTRDAGEVYAHPGPEVARLLDAGALRRIATGYYAMVPLERLGDRRWRPELSAAALGLAQADYGTDVVALMGISAARHHGAIPRAIAAAVVAVPKQRPILSTDVGKIVFVKRDVGRLDLEAIKTSLCAGWVTTVEQTLLDLAARPKLGGLTGRDLDEAINALAARVDWHQAEHLARTQRKLATLDRVARLTGHHHA